MALTIIVEDGTGVANANSYVDVATLRTFASMRGVVLPASDDAVVPFLIQAMDYLESLDYIGTQTLNPPNLQWPRTPPTDTDDDMAMIGWDYPFGYYLEDDDPDTSDETPPFGNNEIPQRLKNAQMQLALAANSGMTLVPSSNGQFVVSEKIGPLETRYSEIRGSQMPSFPVVDALLEPYINVSSQGITTAVGRA